MSISQHNPPLSPKETLPTMYDLPSENQEEPGLPDEFHLLQPELLRQTFKPPAYEEHNYFVASDLNLYYDLQHPQWYKRPDWFAVLGVSRLYEEKDLRLSYVTWQEKVNPLLVIELLSPGTEQEDLGKTLREANKPPNKWRVYQQILKIPYYFVFNRYNNEFQAFGLVLNHYYPLAIGKPGLWLEEAKLGLGLWQGTYQGIERLWLRWYNEAGDWIPTPAEQEHQRAEMEHQRAEQERQRAEMEHQRAEMERQRAEMERQRAEQLAIRLRELGVEPDQI